MTFIFIFDIYIYMLIFLIVFICFSLCFYMYVI